MQFFLLHLCFSYFIGDYFYIVRRYQVLVYVNAQEHGIRPSRGHTTPVYRDIGLLTIPSLLKGGKYNMARFLHLEISDWFEIILPAMLNQSLFISLSDA